MNRNQYIDPFETPTPTPTTETNAQSRGYIDPYEDKQESKLDPYINKATEIISSIPGAQKTISTIAPALDFLSRPSYAVNKFISEYQKPEGELLSSVASAFTELFATGTKRAKLSYSDVIRQKDPEFAYNNPTATQLIGFVGDVALDPTTYLGVGTVGKGIKVAGGSLNKAGTNIVKELLPTLSRKVFVDKGGTLQLIQELPKAEKAASRITKLAEGFEKRVKDSAVVDDAGELIPLYRGTNAPLEKIKGREGIQGLYFTTLPEVADIYAQESGSSVVKAFSNAKKLLDMTAEPTEDLIKVSDRVFNVDRKINVNDVVQRIEEPNIGRAAIDKPHGIYTTPANVTSPHSDLGGNTSYWLKNKNAKILDVSDIDEASSAIRPQAVNAGTGVYALRKLIGDQEFFRLKGLSKNELINISKQQFPNVDFNKYYDSQEVIEALGAQLAKKQGYDAIQFVDKVAPEFSEYVGITKNAMTALPNYSPPVKFNNTEELVNAIRNKLSTEPLIGQNKLIEELKKSGFQGMKFMSDDGGILHQQYLIFNERNIIPAYTSKGLTASKQVKEGTGAIDKLQKAKAELTQRGYFDAVAEKQGELNKVFNNILQGSTTATTDKLATDLAKVEVLTDLTRVARNTPKETLTENEVVERLTTRMTRLVETNPSLINQLLEPKGLYLKLGTPFGKQIPITRIFGTEYLAKQIKVLSDYVTESNKFIPKSLGTIARTFNRDFGLPEEYVKFRNELENELGYLSDEMVRQTRKLFKDIKPEGRERIGQAMHWADDETRKLEEIRKASSDPNFRTLTDGEAAQIFQQSAEKYKLTPEEFAVMSGMQQSYKEAALLEMRAGLLRTNLLNYSARGYEVIENADDMSIITRGKYGNSIPQPYLASSNQRKFLTKAEAEAAGLTPELDAALLYAHRVLSSQRALAIKSFKDSVTELFGTYDPKLKTAHTGILPTAVLTDEAIAKLPAKVISDMKMIGNSVIPSGLNDVQRNILRSIDKMQGIWKRGATTIRPTFAPKQLISNTFQSAMVLGTKAFKAFDPRVAIDSAVLLMRGGKPLDNLAPFIGNWLAKNLQGADSVLAGRVVLQRHFDDVLSDDFLSKFTKTTTLGQQYTGTELVQLMKEKGIIRGFDSTGESFSKKVGESITRQSDSHWRVVKELSKVWNHAGFIEDYSRSMLFLNGIGMGYSADEAVKLVNKALFDYQRGLSAIEKSVIRRTLPFYSFQRFAIPFVLKQTLNRPGDVVTLEKLFRTTEKLLTSGEELTPAEENIFNQKGNNFLLEQPRLLSGFDKTGTSTLNVLNNFTPWDVLNLLTYDKEGNVDVARTAERTFLSAMTPFLKIPASFAANRDFFTGRTIDEASRISGNLDYSIGKVLPDWAKDLVRFETRTNEITGKTTTYLNPYISYYSMQFVPSLREYIKPLTDLDKVNGNFITSAVHYVRKLIDPINEQKYDFEYQQQSELFSTIKDLNDINKGFVKAKLKGDAVGKDTSFEFEDNLLRLQRFLEVIDERDKARANSTVRGVGMTGTTTNIPPDTVPSEVPPIQEPSFK